MKTKKRRMEFISFYNHTGLEKHFTKMAKKGWLIESISNYYWTYRRIEPKEVHFCVTYYPRASEFDPEPPQEQQTFHDFCAHTGWQLCCTWHQMQVFYNEKENPFNTFFKRLGLGEGFDVWSAEDFDLVHVFFIAGKLNHVVVDDKFIGHFELGHIAK